VQKQACSALIWERNGKN